MDRVKNLDGGETTDSDDLDITKSVGKELVELDSYIDSPLLRPNLKACY
jgi:hypothetical protein